MIDKANGIFSRLEKAARGLRIAVYEMNPPTTCTRTRHSLGTLSVQGDSLADTPHLTYVNCIKFDH